MDDAVLGDDHLRGFMEGIMGIGQAFLLFRTQLGEQLQPAISIIAEGLPLFHAPQSRRFKCPACGQPHQWPRQATELKCDCGKWHLRLLGTTLRLEVTPFEQDENGNIILCRATQGGRLTECAGRDLIGALTDGLSNSNSLEVAASLARDSSISIGELESASQILRTGEVIHGPLRLETEEEHEENLNRKEWLEYVVRNAPIAIPDAQTLYSLCAGTPITKDRIVDLLIQGLSPDGIKLMITTLGPEALDNSSIPETILQLRHELAHHLPLTHDLSDGISNTEVEVEGESEGEEQYFPHGVPITTESQLPPCEIEDILKEIIEDSIKAVTGKDIKLRIRRII